MYFNTGLRKETRSFCNVFIRSSVTDIVCCRELLPQTSRRISSTRRCWNCSSSAVRCGSSWCRQCSWRQPWCPSPSVSPSPGPPFLLLKSICSVDVLHDNIKYDIMIYYILFNILMHSSMWLTYIDTPTALWFVNDIQRIVNSVETFLVLIDFLGVYPYESIDQYFHSKHSNAHRISYYQDK